MINVKIYYMLTNAYKVAKLHHKQKSGPWEGCGSSYSDKRLIGCIKAQNLLFLVSVSLSCSLTDNPLFLKLLSATWPGKFEISYLVIGQEVKFVFYHFEADRNYQALVL